VSNYDSPWKEILELYFQQFLEFFFPEAHNDIDWDKGYESKEQELQQLFPNAQSGKLFVDKLILVWLKEGGEARVYIHVEIQSQRDSDFPERIYIYHNRILEMYGSEVVSFAILGDDSPKWRPQQYVKARWGCRKILEFPIVKLLDYQSQWQTLEESQNPFAVVVMAHLRTLSTTNNSESRLQFKVNLIKLLYQRNYSQEEIIQLFRFIDWMMTLPKELEKIYHTEIEAIEERKPMSYITTFEMRGMLKVRREDVINVLKVRFQEVPLELIEAINNIQDLSLLEELVKQAITANSLQEFQNLLPQE
jgi:hypothetical protein